MRTTLNTIYSRIQTNLGKITTDMTRVNEQISSGQQMAKLSDEPVSLVNALRFRSTIVELDQYTENIQNGNTIINAAESALTQMKELALRAKTLAIQATDPGYATANREAIAEEINNMFEQAVALGNTQINGKYIFGGFRTTGYDDIEPAPFMIDKGDGYWINGRTPPALPTALTGNTIESAATADDLGVGDLLINGVDVRGLADIDLNGVADVNGLNMEGAFQLRDAINNAPITPAVTASLTTLIYGAAASAGAAAGQNIDFTINDVQVAYLTAGTLTAEETAQEAVDAINAVADKTGVTALLGDGTNGGPDDAVILKNTLAGDESAIILDGLPALGVEEAILGLTENGPAGQGADHDHNTGQVSLSANATISITTSGATGDPLTATDDILDRIGLSGLGNFDAADDGSLVYGYPLTDGELKINGFEVPAPTSDELSDVYADASAAAKATAINTIEPQTGVTAIVVPAHVTASRATVGGTESERLTGTVDNNTILAGNLAINNTVIATDIATGAINFGLNTEKAFNARTEINAIALTTGVNARLTTLYAGGAAATAGSTQSVSFDINNVTVSLVAGGVSAADTATDIVNAINAVSRQSGVQAAVGDGANGGAINAIVLRNVIHGDETDIDLTNLSAGEETLSGLTAGAYSVDDTYNTGELSFESESSLTITSPTSLHDVYLARLGLSSETNSGQISYGSTPNLKKDDLTINGIPIITTAITNKDVNNTLLNAINDQSSRTGVKATRDQSGIIQLTALDGRNIHVETSANGEAITHLTNGVRNQITFGSLQLRSDRKFILETVDPSINLNEPGLATLGMAGGETISAEANDVANDGKISVLSIHDRTGSVRYTGDRANDLEVKIGKTSTLAVGENGKTGVMDSTIFSTLKALENYLQGKNFIGITGIHAASDISATLNSKATGLEPQSLLPTEDLFTNGTFKITVTDHDYYPPSTSAITIAVDPAVDTLESVTKRINGLPNINASWTDDGHLKIESSNTERYTIALTNDSSNFLQVTGVSPEFMQSEAVIKSIADLDTLMENLTRQVSDFGSRANRIEIQSQIYSNMAIATKENLSEVQDTDMIKAIMELKTKETAYQAALSSAAKTMQLSLVDYLR